MLHQMSSIWFVMIFEEFIQKIGIRSFNLHIEFVIPTTRAFQEHIAWP